ncbi:MAG TPA: hypothetical protein VII08_00465 [Myxococcales bacterium]
MTAVRRFVPVLLLLALPTLRPGLAAGLDRDMLLTEAPAVPNAGTVRVSGAANGQPSGATDSGSTGGISGSILWAPIDRIAGDVGIYLQGPDSGPTVRVRIQVLKQADVGLDLAVGARFKEFGFFKKQSSGSPNGEFEFLLAAGRSFGRFETMLNTVIGFEAGGPGSDIEGKAFAGYRISPSLRAGLDGRVQAEYKDETGTKSPNFTNDMALVAGPALAFLTLQDKLQIQGLVGVAKPKGTGTISPGGLLAASFDF